MARNVNELIATLPAARRRRIEKRAQLLLDEEMSLQELRRARKLKWPKPSASLKNKSPTSRNAPTCTSPLSGGPLRLWAANFL